MKLNATDLRYITPDEWRILTATEQGSRTHEVVPAALIAQLAGLRGGGANKCMGSLAKRNLIAKLQNMKYEGYRLTYGGLDYLALKALSKRNSIHSVGQQVGIGKESDIHLVADEEGNRMILKMHRLGRISFRSVKSKRDYLGKRQSATWMHMSRLSAAKEYAFMNVLYEHGFPVPTPIDHSRHCIVMSLADAVPMRDVHELEDVGTLYSELMNLIVRLARSGLIHGDYNEFNILINKSDSKPILIDFPQMVSTSHVNAEMYFDRDVQCIRKFFKKRFRFESQLYPTFEDSIKGEKEGDEADLDAKVKASGFSKKMQSELESYMNLPDQGIEDDSDAANGTYNDNDKLKEEELSEDDDILDEETRLNQAEHVKDVTDSGGELIATARTSKVQFAPSTEQEQTSLGESNSSPTQAAGASTSSSKFDFDTAAEAFDKLDLGIKNDAAQESTSQELAVENAGNKINVPMLEVEISQALREKVAEDLKKKQSKSERKHHTRKSLINLGRPSGSKKKQGVRITLDSEF